jgi:hypothetical protein
MVDTIHLYISAAADLKQERDLLSRAMVEIPVTLAWRIVQTPLHGETLDLQAIAQADLHLLLIGGDIRAPVGLEWQVARRARRLPVLFLNQDDPRTPAALAFTRYLSEYATWHTFQDRSGLRKQVLLLVADHILEHAVYYALTPGELERLRAWREELEKSEPERAEETRGGAGESSVIFSAERYLPSQGVLLKDHKKGLE